MFCSNCGQQLDEGSLFCPNCGNKIYVESNSTPKLTPAAGATPSLTAVPEKKPVNKALLAGAIISGVAVIAATSVGIYALTHKGSDNTPVAGDDKPATQESDNSIIGLYQSQVDSDNGHNIALINFDGDETPELIYTKNSAYKMFTIKDNTVTEISLSPGNTTPDLYGNKFYNGDSQPAGGKYEHFFFEYVPGAKLIRTHSAQSSKNDYYISFDENMTPSLSLQSSWNGVWNTYIDNNGAENESFNEQRVARGFDKLIKCEYYYSDVQTAYDNMNNTPATSDLLRKFVTGEIDGVDNLSGINTDIDEFTKTTSSYMGFRSGYGDSDRDSEYEFKDYDNDGIDELLVYGSSFSCLFFDTNGDDVCFQFSAGGMADYSEIVNHNGANCVVRSDTTHQGRQYRNISTFDACGCLVDWYELYTEYYNNEYDRYDANSTFMYRGRAISMSEYETLYNDLYGIVKTDEQIRNKEVISAYEAYVNGLNEYATLNKFDFIYLDDDDIPELVGTVDGSNFLLFTYQNGTVSKLPNELFPSWSHFYYKPSAGDFYYNLYASPESQSYAYTYKNGKLTQTASWIATYGETDDGMGYLGDDNYYHEGEEGYIYYINDEQVSEDEYYDYSSNYDDFTLVEGQYDDIWSAADAFGLNY